jgi:hypothetical protein
VTDPPVINIYLPLGVAAKFLQAVSPNPTLGMGIVMILFVPSNTETYPAGLQGGGHAWETSDEGLRGERDSEEPNAEQRCSEVAHFAFLRDTNLTFPFLATAPIVSASSRISACSC